MQADWPAARPYVCGIDIGGTFTDCVLVGPEGAMAVKAPTTPAAPADGLLDALSRAAEKLSLPLGELMRQIDRLLLGSTIGTNMVVQRAGVRVGVITTRGFRDTLAIMRGSLGISAGRPVEELARPAALVKPTPLVRSEDIREVDERCDEAGQVLVGLNEAQLREAVADLVRDGVAAIAVCFLWSCRNRAHEQRAAAIASEVSPQTLVTCSTDVSHAIGEYERFVGAVVNAYIGPVSVAAVRGIEDEVAARGFAGECLYLNCSGGVLPRAMAEHIPVLLLGSGPAGGAAASEHLAARRGDQNVVFCDMGGTSFDAGLIADGKTLLADELVLDGYSMHLPRADIISIGAGGGSMAWVDGEDGSHSLKVGPRSAGSFPGPVCFGRGGTQPTVTDADLVLGFLEPESGEAGMGLGRRLDLEAARRVCADLGKTFGWSAEEAAAAIVQIVDAQTANLISEMTVERGHNPRDFTAYVYGGAGPLHAGGFCKSLRLRDAYVPLGTMSSVWSAYGAANAPIVRVIGASTSLRTPWNIADLQALLEEVDRQAVAFVRDFGSPAYPNIDHRLQFRLSYTGQAHSLLMALDPFLSGKGVLRPDAPEEIVDAYYRWYDERYGAGFAYRGRAVQLHEARCTVVLSAAESISGLKQPARPPRADARRQVWWPQRREWIPTPVVDGLALEVGERITGPAIIGLGGPVVLVHPGQAATKDPMDGVVLSFGEGSPA